MTSKAQLQANAKYHEKLDDIKIRVKKGEREKYKAYAESKGKSLNALIIELLENDMNGSQSETQTAGADTLELSAAVPTASEREECENILPNRLQTVFGDYTHSCSVCKQKIKCDMFTSGKILFCPCCGRRIKQ